MLFGYSPLSQALAVSRALALAVLFVALSRYTATVQTLAPLHVIDDAYITYRYAEHWAAGYGPVWNIGDAPVEGYTCPLYVGLLAAARWAWQVDIPTFSQQVGIIAGWATLLALFVIAWWLVGLPYAAIVTSAVAVEPSMVVWAVGGMRIASDSAAIDRQIRMGQWLAVHVHDRSTLVAASDCGVLPYYSDLPVLDLAGLNDARMARDRGDMAYLTARNPGLLVFEDTPATLGGQRLLASGRYVEVPLKGFENVHLYQNRELPPLP